jgi:hypothetical protein
MQSAKCKVQNAKLRFREQGAGSREQEKEINNKNLTTYQPINLLWLKAKSQWLIARISQLTNHQLTKYKRRRK